MKEYILKLVILLIAPFIGTFICLLAALCLAFVIVLMGVTLFVSPVLAFFGKRTGMNIKYKDISLFTFQENKSDPNVN